MATRTIHLTNTLPGHNKDYTISWDQMTGLVSCTWGPIGGFHSSRVIPHANPDDAGATVMGKVDRRVKRGYVIVSDIMSAADDRTRRAPVATMQSYDFNADIREMRRAEHLV